MWAWPWYADIGQIWNTLNEWETRMSELDDRLAAIGTQLGKARTEIVGLIDQLRAEINANAVQPATLDALTEAAQTLDDIVADTPSG